MAKFVTFTLSEIEFHLLDKLYIKLETFEKGGGSLLHHLPSSLLNTVMLFILFLKSRLENFSL